MFRENMADTVKNKIYSVTFNDRRSY